MSSSITTDISELKRNFRASLTAGEHDKALEFIAKAIQLSPQDAEPFLARAFVYIQKGQLNKAISSIQHSEQFIGDDPQSVNYAAGLYSHCEKYAASERLYLRALALKPNDAELHYNLGTILRFTGRLEAAAESFDRSFRLNPKGHESLCLLADVTKQTSDSNHISELKSFLARDNIKVPARIQLQYALAKEYEDLEEWGLSFQALTKGAKLKRQHMRYSLSNDQAIMADIANTYRAIRPQSSPAQSATPIFILGLPRTGSTLIETLLARHHSVVSGGELTDFSKQLDQLIDLEVAKSSKALTTSERIDASSSIDFGALGENYLNAVAEKVNYTSHFTDKLPFNFLYCGLILQALPNAKIIHTRRDPMDSCYAIYKTLFRRAYPYSYDLDELTDYLIAYWRLMKHWRAIMPNNILDVDYEAVVSDTEGQAKRMVEFCGLDWDPACLDYEKTTAVTTASASQVRQPVYSSSVQKWRNVEEHFKPVEDKIRAAGIIPR